MRVLNAVSVVVLLLLLPGTSLAAQAPGLPDQLTDAEFWRLFTEFSDASGDYPYQNFMTNEETFQDIMPILTKVTKPGGVYLGVGPEQQIGDRELFRVAK